MKRWNKELATASFNTFRLKLGRSMKVNSEENKTRISFNVYVLEN